MVDPLNQGQMQYFNENSGPLSNELMRFPDDGSFVPYNETSIAALAHHAAGGVFGGQSRPLLPTGNMATNILNAAPDPSHAPLSAPSQHTQLPALLGPQAGIPNAPAVQDVTFSFEIRGSADRHPYTVYLSRPAQIEDLGQFDPNDRSYIHEYLKTNGKQGNAELKQWYKEICPAYWSNIIRLCANDIPASMVDEVHKQLCASKFGIKDPWSGHALFKRVWNPSRQDKNQGYNIIRLKAWMYGGEETTQQTWRETLRSKDEEKDRVVPWVPREVILAVWVIMKEGKAEDPSNPSMVKKREELEACKLMYQISNQEWVQPDPYWEGFMEELALDPQQEHLYAKVMEDAPAVPAVPAVPAAPAAPAAPAPAAVPAAHTQEIIADKDAYIAFLEGLLHENGIEFPRRRDA
ncbi:hypothetical protein SLS53_008007 [Cytospora paraplurivora]|uniref:Uncharacterized protein n=1 Tax=Cytospora paraplurivora TaxID=2898453 RepID=A0AAN9U806_9PEZI